MIARKSLIALAGAAALLAVSPDLSASPAAPEKNERPAAAAPAYQLLGFRSARFGMTEAEVRAAIRKDFSVKDADITVEHHPTEKTTALMVAVPDVLEGQGKAMIAYVLGYRSKTLSQVTVTWSQGTDPAIGPQTLATSADILLRHLVAQGYQREGMVVNGLRADGGIVVFRGNDAQGRTSVLLLSGPLADKGEEGKVLTPAILQLSYLKDAANPDIFSLAKGAF